MKTLYPFQEPTIPFALSRRGTLIADEMGLGKTSQAINIILRSNSRNNLIVCPASLKYNWRAELQSWGFDGPISMVGENRPQIVRGSPSRYATIVNYDILHKLPIYHEWDTIVFDEIHYCKNAKAKRTVKAQMLSQRGKRIIGLSGTPLTSRPIELWSILKMLAPYEFPETEKQFAHKYCDAKMRYVYTKWGRKLVWDYSGASKLDELNERLRAVMVRRLKRDVLTDLPEKIREIIVLGEVSRELELDESEDFDVTVKRLQKGEKIPFEQIAVMRRLQATAKLDACVRFIENALESSNKIILFAHHTAIIEGLRDALAAYSPVTITGRTTTEDREAAVRRFQYTDTCRLFIGSILAAGTGLTLTAASHVIFIELDWTPGVMTQCEDRAHRIGQRNPVLVQHLVVDGTIDAVMCKKLVAKQNVLDKVLI